MKPAQKLKKAGFRVRLDWGTHEDWGACTLRGYRSLVPLPKYLALYISSIWLFWVISFYNKPAILAYILYNKPAISKMFFWVLWAALANYTIPGRGHWNIQSTTSWTGDWHLKWGVGGGRPYTIELLPCGIWHYLQIVSKMSWSAGYPVSVWELLGGVGKKASHCY